MRTFIVSIRIDNIDVDGEAWSEIDMQLFEAFDIQDLFKKINKYYDSEIILYNEGTELDILNQVSESNGDGDYYFMIGELITDNGKIEMKMLLQ